MPGTTESISHNWTFLSCQEESANLMKVDFDTHVFYFSNVILESLYERCATLRIE